MREGCSPTLRKHGTNVPAEENVPGKRTGGWTGRRNNEKNKTKRTQ